jgi:arylsulfatase A-like enzyme
MDADIGRIMDEIRSDSPNTIVILTADKGAWLDAYPDRRNDAVGHPAEIRQCLFMTQSGRHSCDEWHSSSKARCDAATWRPTLGTPCAPRMLRKRKVSIQNNPFHFRNQIFSQPNIHRKRNSKQKK